VTLSLTGRRRSTTTLSLCVRVFAADLSTRCRHQPSSPGGN
jgi:hypothetical protein